MTVRANKPAFNVREKLKELDYSHIPYEKMPFGSVIQYKTTHSSYNVNTNSSSYSNLTGVTLLFGPKLSNSILEISLTGTVRLFPGGNTRSRPGFQLVRSGTVLSGYNFNEAIQLRNCNFNGSNVEVCIPFHFILRDVPNSTENLEYTWQWRNVDNQYIDMAGVTFRQSIIEIKQ